MLTRHASYSKHRLGIETNLAFSSRLTKWLHDISRLKWHRLKLHWMKCPDTKQNTLNSVYNDYVYNDIPVIAIEFHGPGQDASI